MKILFGKKYFGKDVSECPSNFLLWIIESYRDADIMLIRACKEELSQRLKLDWEPPTDAVATLTKQLTTARTRIDLLEKIIALHGAAAISAEKYLRNPALLESDLQILRSLKLS